MKGLGDKTVDTIAGHLVQMQEVSLRQYCLETLHGNARADPEDAEPLPQSLGHRNANPLDLWFLLFV